MAAMFLNNPAMLRNILTDKHNDKFQLYCLSDPVKAIGTLHRSEVS